MVVIEMVVSKIDKKIEYSVQSIIYIHIDILYFIKYIL